MLVKNRLMEMRRLLNNGWTREYYWTNAKGRIVPRETATHFCIVGAAAMAACETAGFSAIGISRGAQALFKAIQPHLPDPYRNDECALRACIRFNDQQKNAEGILAAIDKAIEVQLGN